MKTVNVTKDFTSMEELVPDCGRQGLFVRAVAGARLAVAAPA